MKYIFIALIVLMSVKSFGQNYDSPISLSKSQDSLVNKFEFYSFKNEFPILEGKNSVYNLILTQRQGVSPSFTFNYNLKKALIDNKYIDEKPNSKITSELFLNILGNGWYNYPKTEVLFKGQSEGIEKSIYSIDTKLIKKSFIFYDKNEYYIGETISENGKLIKKGYGAYFFNNGDRYEGFWNNDLKNGQGCMFYRTSGSTSVKKEILYHLNDNIVLRLFTFLSNGDIIFTSGEWKNNSGEWKNTQVYFNFNKSNPGYLGTYSGDLVNNLPNGDGVKSNYQNGKFVNETRGFFVDGKISVEDKKKPEYGELVALTKEESNNLSIGEKQVSIPQTNTSIPQTNNSEKLRWEELRKNCYVCLGTGIAKHCPICKSTGVVHCNSCKGRGYNRNGSVCLTCKRTGITTCILCKGKKKGFKCDHITWYMIIQDF
jgi:hypothetical protein